MSDIDAELKKLQKRMGHGSYGPPPTKYVPLEFNGPAAATISEAFVTAVDHENRVITVGPKEPVIIVEFKGSKALPIDLDYDEYETYSG